MHYRRIWEIANNKKIPSGYEIHHIDGNRKNNDPNNLKLVSIEEHLEIHKQQEDWGAVQAILMRMENCSKQQSIEAASKTQKNLLLAGRHNFQKISKEEKKEINKRIMKERKDAGLPAFLNIKDTVENSRKAGLMAAEKRAGFLNTESEKHGSKKVRNTFWWVNQEGKRIRSKECPGIEWQKGMTYKKEKNES